MLFRELENIELPWYDPEAAIQILKTNYSIRAPDSVIRQFYIDHRDKDEFVYLYGDLDLNEVEWKLQEFPTDKLVSVGDSATHPDYLKDESDRAKYYEQMGSKVIDNRSEVVEYWLENGKWKMENGKWKMEHG